MFTQAEVAMGGKDRRIKALTPNHYWPWKALHSIHICCFKYQRSKDGVGINHDSASSSKSFNDLDACCLGSFDMNELLRFPGIKLLTSSHGLHA